MCVYAYICLSIFWLDAVSFSRTMYEIHENDGPLQVVLLLDKPALDSITVKIVSTEETATGKDCVYNSFESHVRM